MSGSQLKPPALPGDIYWAVRIVFLACLGVLLFLGPPIIGWGVGDLGGFFANPARLAFGLLVIAQSILFAAVATRLPGRGRSRGQASKVVVRQRFALLPFVY